MVTLMLMEGSGVNGLKIRQFPAEFDENHCYVCVNIVTCPPFSSLYANLAG